MPAYSRKALKFLKSIKKKKIPPHGDDSVFKDLLPDFPYWSMKVKVLVAQSCLTLCNSMDYSPPGSSVHGSPGKNTRVGSHSLHQGIFPIQRSNLGVLHCRWILCCLSHQGSPSYSFSVLYNLQFCFFFFPVMWVVFLFF